MKQHVVRLMHRAAEYFDIKTKHLPKDGNTFSCSIVALEDVYAY